MKKIKKFSIHCIVTLLLIQGCNSINQKNTYNSLTPYNMELTSQAFADGEKIPSKFTCDGEDISPSLTISGVPQEAKSLALVIHDPDAPGPKGFTHWILYNIDPKTKEIPENSVPDGSSQALTDFGSSDWGGPCPPSGVHRYNFMLYALDAKLIINKIATKEILEQMMQGHILETATLMGTYERN